MKRRLTILTCATAIAFALAAPTAFAATSTIPVNNPNSTSLVEHAGSYDKLAVTFTGEAIGEVMVRGEYAWIHLNDDAYMERNVEEGAKLGGYNSGMAIWIPSALTGQIDTYGDYKHEGSIATVEGVFNSACAEHGGDMDIHATTLKVIIPGHEVVDVVHPWKVWLALGLISLAVGLWWLDRLTRNVVRPNRGV